MRSKPSISLSLPLGMIIEGETGKIEMNLEAAIDKTEYELIRCFRWCKSKRDTHCELCKTQTSSLKDKDGRVKNRIRSSFST